LPSRNSISWETLTDPILAFFGTHKQKLVDLDRRVQRFVPDLAVEIASESDTYDGLLRKKERYRRASVAEVWLISVSNREIARYAEGQDRILRAEDVLVTELLPAFSVAVEVLFQGL
jgi:Uma2 family endonuclease